MTTPPDRPDWTTEAAKLLSNPHIRGALDEARKLFSGNGATKPEDPPAGTYSPQMKEAIRGFILSAYWDHEITGQDAAVLLKRLDAS